MGQSAEFFEVELLEHCGCHGICSPFRDCLVQVVGRCRKEPAEAEQHLELLGELPDGLASGVLV